MSESVKKTKSNLPGPGPGRPKGVPNKVTQTAKDAIAKAADDLGGVQRLVDWAKEDPANERAFWTSIYTKLLPLQMDAKVQGTLTVNWPLPPTALDG